MKPSCSSCAHAFREEWSRDTDALRCGYRGETGGTRTGAGGWRSHDDTAECLWTGDTALSEGQGDVHRRNHTTGVVLRALFIHIAETGRSASCLPGTVSRH